MKAESTFSEVQQTTSTFHSTESGLQILPEFPAEHSCNKLSTPNCGEMETAATEREFNRKTPFFVRSISLIAFLIS